MITILPFLLTLIAGLSTLLGTIFTFIKVDITKLIKYALAFSAGVMISVSLTDLIPESLSYIQKDLNKNSSFIIVFIFIILGILISLTIDTIIPQAQNKDKKIYRVGVLSALSIIIHNIPEGIITYLSSTQNLKLGIALTIAITMHNIPEGISISIPIYAATKNKKTAFFYTLISALAEPFGALLAFLFLQNIITNLIMGHILAFTAGIMLYISIFELLPTSIKINQKRGTIISLIIGILFIIVTHLLSN